MKAAVLPLTSMDAAILRQVAAKVDDDEFDVKDADALRSIADTIDAVFLAVDEQRTKQAQGRAETHFEIDDAGMIGKPSSRPGFYTVTMFDENQRVLKLRLGKDAKASLYDLLQCDETVTVDTTEAYDIP